MTSQLRVVETSFYINTDEAESEHDPSTDDVEAQPEEDVAPEEEDVPTVSPTEQALQIIGDLQRELPAFSLLTDAKYPVEQSQRSSSSTILLTAQLPRLTYTAPPSEEEQSEELSGNSHGQHSVAPQCIYTLLQHIQLTLIPDRQYAAALQKLQQLLTLWELPSDAWYKLYDWQNELEIVQLDWVDYLSEHPAGESEAEPAEEEAADDEQPPLARQASTASTSGQPLTQEQRDHRRFASTGSEIYLLPGDEELFQQQAAAAAAAAAVARPVTPPRPPLPAIPSAEIYVLRFYTIYLIATCYNLTQQVNEAIVHYNDAMNTRDDLDESLLAIPYEYAMVDDAAADDENVDDENRPSSVQALKKRTYLNACTALDAIAFISMAAAMRSLHFSHVSLQCLDTALQISTAIRAAGSHAAELQTVVLNNIACGLSDCRLYQQAQTYFEAAYSNAQTHTSRASPILSSIERNQNIIAQHVTQIPSIGLFGQVDAIRAAVARQKAIEARRKVKKAPARNNQPEAPTDPTQITELFRQPLLNKKGDVVQAVSKTFPARSFVVEPSAFKVMQMKHPAIKKKVVDPKAKKR